MNYLKKYYWTERRNLEKSINKLIKDFSKKYTKNDIEIIRLRSFKKEVDNGRRN